MTETKDYGGYYWCVKSGLSESGDIYLYADDVRLTKNGELEFYQLRDDEPQLLFAVAPGQWKAVYAASVFDGSAVAVQHWRGEVVN